VTRYSIALVSFEVWPFVPGGGLGRAIWSTARLLAPHADVTIVTSERHRPLHDRLLANHDPALPDGVRFAFAPEPTGDVSPFHSWQHAWSARLCATLRSIAPRDGFDLVEFPDYWGQAAVSIEARRAGDPAFRGTLVLVRTHTSHEMIAALDREPLSAQTHVVRALERASLRFADRLLSPAQPVLDSYERYYGPEGLAPASILPLPFDPPGRTPEDPPKAADGPLRLLYLGRLQRLKGVEELVRAVRDLPDAPLRLTLIGRDTATGPAGTSMRAHLQRLAGSDPRIELRDAVPHAELGEAVSRQHVIVIPSLFEAWNYVVREALSLNRPVLATPVGGIPAAFAHPGAGWLAGSADAAALRDAIEALVARRREIDELIAERAPRRALEATVASEAIVAGYAALAAARKRSAPSRRRDGRVLAIVSACERDARPDATIQSLFGQTLPVEVVVAGEGAGRLPAPAVLDRLTGCAVVPPGAGRTAARRAALAQAGAGYDYVLLADAGDVLLPTFVERALEAFSGDPGITYVSAHGCGRQPHAAPLSNWVLPATGKDPAIGPLVLRAGALARDLPEPSDTGGEERALVGALADEGRFGAVIPERLVARLRRRDVIPPGRDPLPAVATSAWTSSAEET
jgi:glycogen synthase